MARKSAILPSTRTMLKMALTTVGTMYVLNVFGSRIPVVRGFIKANNGLTVVGGTDAGNTQTAGIVNSVSDIFGISS